MAISMSRRERVARAIRGEEVDRVPTYDILMNDDVIEYYAGETLTVENGRQVKAKAISRCLDMTRMVFGPNAPGTYESPDGHAWQTERWTSWITKRPYHDVEGLAEWVKTQITALNAADTVESSRRAVTPASHTTGRAIYGIRRFLPC